MGISLFGFGLPVALLAGFIFGKWFGTFILVIGLSFYSFYYNDKLFS